MGLNLVLAVSMAPIVSDAEDGSLEASAAWSSPVKYCSQFLQLQFAGNHNNIT